MTTSPTRSRTLTRIGAATVAATTISIGVVGAASTAWANPGAPTIGGQYIYDQPTPALEQTIMWTFTSKGPGDAQVSSDWFPNGAEAKFVNGHWQIDVDCQATCTVDDKPCTATNHFVWDPATGNGTTWAIWKEDSECGKAGEKSGLSSFTLTEAERSVS